VASGLVVKSVETVTLVSLISLELAQSWLSGRREDSRSCSVRSFDGNDVCITSDSI
jgi:hypothetical protein